MTALSGKKGGKESGSMGCAGGLERRRAWRPSPLDPERSLQGTLQVTQIPSWGLGHACSGCCCGFLLKQY